MNPITEEMLERYRADYENDRHARTMTAAAAKTELKDLAFLPVSAAKLNGDFEIEVKTNGVTAQEKSGRCWLFAALNIMREKAAEKCNLKEFKLSGNYLSFYDKLEKANNALELAIRDAEKPLTDRDVEYALHGFWDGGYWDMAADLVKKYGAVPASVMPESYQSEHTEKFMKLLATLVRKDMAELRRMVRAGEDVTARKDAMMQEIYKAECIVFGEPVRTFDFEYRDQDGNFHSDRGLTPRAFFEKYIDWNVDDYVTITNEPTDIRKLNMYYKFHYIGSMADSDVKCLNLSMDELEDLCIRQLKGGEPVWFGCDSGAYGDRQEGVWDPDSFDYNGLLGNVDLFMNKKDRLEYRDSFATHAMILTGVSFDDDGRPARWKIENSWGKDVGRDGYFVCSENYFREYVYEGIIHKKYLSEAQLALLDTEPVTIKPWEE